MLLAIREQQQQQASRMAKARLNGEGTVSYSYVKISKAGVIGDRKLRSSTENLMLSI